MALFDRFKKKAEDAAESAKEATESAAEAAAEKVDEVKESVVEATESAPETAPPVEPPPSGEYRAVKVNPGKKGWGNGLVIKPEPGKDLIYSVTGGGIHPVAQRIADLTGGKTFDGFKSKADFHEIACAVIDCGGTARIGVYPMKGVLTVDVHGASPSGPLMRFITEENFVSGTGLDDIEVVE
jgi:hypothetical protein